jgi:hypothetical protein
LECVGPYSYFTFPHKELHGGLSPAGLIVGAHSTAALLNYDLYFIDTKGKTKYANFSYTEKYLSSQKELLKSFQKDTEPYLPYEYGTAPEPETEEILQSMFSIIRSYLLRLNEALTRSPKS